MRTITLLLAMVKTTFKTTDIAAKLKCTVHRGVQIIKCFRKIRESVIVFKMLAIKKPQTL